MGYVSINRLSLMIQEKISKLNAGNLSMEELDELKELTRELNERVIVLQYKAAETQLLKQADAIIQHRESKTPGPEQEITPIKISLGVAPAVKTEPVTEPKTEPVKPVLTEMPKPQEPVKPADPVVKAEEKPVVSQAEPVIPKTEPVTLVKPQETTQPVIPTTPPAKVSLVERMQKTKINSLKTAIGLNQKFLFMNFLFEGENSSYNDAIEKLDNMPTAADARHYIRELAYIYNWNYEDENVVLFTEYVERRHL